MTSSNIKVNCIIYRLCREITVKSIYLCSNSTYYSAFACLFCFQVIPIVKPLVLRTYVKFTAAKVKWFSSSVELHSSVLLSLLAHTEPENLV